MTISDRVELRVRRPAVRDGKEVKITTVKTTATDDDDSRTVKRTIDGERADLQLKSIKHSDGAIEFVHIHCMRDKETSDWRKTSGLPIEKFYEVTQKAATSWEIRCKTCGGRWSSAGETQTL